MFSHSINSVGLSSTVVILYPTIPDASSVAFIVTVVSAAITSVIIGLFISVPLKIYVVH